MSQGEETRLQNLHCLCFYCKSVERLRKAFSAQLLAQFARLSFYFPLFLVVSCSPAALHIICRIQSYFPFSLSDRAGERKESRQREGEGGRDGAAGVGGWERRRKTERKKKKRKLKNLQQIHTSSSASSS